MILYSQVVMLVAHKKLMNKIILLAIGLKLTIIQIIQIFKQQIKISTKSLSLIRFFKRIKRFMTILGLMRIIQLIQVMSIFMHKMKSLMKTKD